MTSLKSSPLCKLKTELKLGNVCGIQCRCGPTLNIYSWKTISSTLCSCKNKAHCEKHKYHGLYVQYTVSYIYRSLYQNESGGLKVREATCVWKV